MTNVPNVGDILMVSQISWKIGRAFAAGQKTAPTEFQEIETEINGLARQLKRLAEALHAASENSLIQQASEHVQHGIGIVLDSCKRTVNDLDSLVDHNQVIKKHRTVGGFAIERSWNDLVLAEYATMIWTAEGGDLDNLKDLLQMHTGSIMLLTQALQRLVVFDTSTVTSLIMYSKSHSRLESVVSPMADRIDGIHQNHGTFDGQLEEVHDMLQSLMMAIPQSPPIPARNPARSPIVEASNPLGTSLRSTSSPPRRSNIKVSLPTSPQHPKSPDRPTSPQATITIRDPSSPTETMSTSRASSPTQKRVSEFSFGGSSLRYSSSSYASSTASSGGWSSPGTPLINQQSSTTTRRTLHLPRTPEVEEPGQRVHEGALSLLPPPALGYAAHPDVERPVSRSTLSPYPATQPDILKLHRSSTTSSQKAAFEKEAFRNSAVLCDV
jgi:hypothetical protein